jgi:hypothetical protein
VLHELPGSQVSVEQRFDFRADVGPIRMRASEKVAPRALIESTAAENAASTSAQKASDPMGAFTRQLRREPSSSR